jgi:translation initiation factor 5B
MEEILEAKKAAAAEDAVFPCVLEVLEMFHSKDPIILGCRVVEGTLRIGTPIAVPSRHNLKLGKVRGVVIVTAPSALMFWSQVSKIESNHVERPRAVEGDEVAVQIDAGGV